MVAPQRDHPNKENLRKMDVPDLNKTNCPPKISYVIPSQRKPPEKPDELWTENIKYGFQPLAVCI